MLWSPGLGRASSSLGRAMVVAAIHGLVLAAAPLVVNADATLRVVSGTECPGPRQLEAAMPDGVSIADEADLVLETSRVGLTTRVRILGPDGTVVERTIRSADCTALALVIGEIVRGRLLELRMLPEAGETEARESEPSARRPSETDVHETEARDQTGEVGARGPSAEPGLEAVDSTAAATPAPGSPVPEVSPEPVSPAAESIVEGRHAADGAPDPSTEPLEGSPDGARGLTLRIALAAGPTLATDGLVSGGGRGAVILATDALLFRLVLAAVAPEVRGPSEERVELVPVDLALGVGLSSRDAVRIEGGADVGLELLVVRSLDLPTDASPRALPIVEPWFAVAVEILPVLAFRAELSATFLPLTERYVVQPAGVVARTPIARMALWVGAEVTVP